MAASSARSTASAGTGFDLSYFTCGHGGGAVVAAAAAAAAVVVVVVVAAVVVLGIN